MTLLSACCTAVLLTQQADLGAVDVLTASTGQQVP